MIHKFELAIKPALVKEYKNVVAFSHGFLHCGNHVFAPWTPQGFQPQGPHLSFSKLA